MIEKSVRTIGEQHTSIDYPIEKSQKGIIAFGHKHGEKILFIPTMIEDPKLVTITALNDACRKVLAQGWSCDLVLYGATNASIATVAKAATGASNASGGEDIVVIYDGKLYQSLPGNTASGSQLASASLVTASSSLFKRIDWYASNAKRLLKIHTLSSTASAKYIKYSYEVKGY